jgi:hypothetical protein
MTKDRVRMTLKLHFLAEGRDFYDTRRHEPAGALSG